MRYAPNRAPSTQARWVSPCSRLRPVPSRALPQAPPGAQSRAKAHAPTLPHALARATHRSRGCSSFPLRIAYLAIRLRPVHFLCKLASQCGRDCHWDGQSAADLRTRISPASTLHSPKVSQNSIKMSGFSFDFVGSYVGKTT